MFDIVEKENDLRKAQESQDQQNRMVMTIYETVETHNTVMRIQGFIAGAALALGGVYMFL